MNKPSSKILSISLLTLATLAAQKPVTAAAADAESVLAGTGKVKFNGLLQAWSYNDTSALTDPRFNFRLRRAELQFSGTVAEGTRWFLKIDPAKTLATKSTSASGTVTGTSATGGAVTGTSSTSVSGVVDTAADTRVLQDLGVAFSLTPDLELVAGQFKTPNVAEGLDSSGELLFPERSRVARKFGDRREPGAMLTYKWEQLKVQTMVSNGTGTNADDTTNAKDLNVRAEGKLTDWATLGAFTTAGDFGYYKKGRWGGNLRLSHENALVRFEGIRATDSGVNTNALVADAGYTLGQWQPVARYGLVNNGIFSAREATLGVNYFVMKHGAKIQAAYTQLTDMTTVTGSPVEAQNRGGGLFQLNFQAAI